MAIKYAKNADICMVCDDDCCYDDDFEDKIIAAADSYPSADVFAFQLVFDESYYAKKRFWKKSRRIGYLDALKISSVQIAFKRKRIIEKGVIFDEEIGSGMTKAGGEEKIFLHECLSKGLTIQYVPVNIGMLSYNVSQWAESIFSPEYFVDLGYYTKRLKGGKLFAFTFCTLFAIKKYNFYSLRFSIFKCLGYMYKGIFIK